MEKKLILTFIVLATLSLVWVFSYMCRSEHQTDFTATNPNLYSVPGADDNLTANLPVAPVSFYETGRMEYTCCAHSASEPRMKKIEKVRVSVKNSNPVPHKKSDSNEVKGMKANEAFNFCIESFQISPSNKWLNEYEFNYKRIRGNIPAQDESVQVITVPRSDVKS
jgi:hypothetical protein